jgi:hypothetical protein
MQTGVSVYIPHNLEPAHISINFAKDTNKQTLNNKYGKRVGLQ